MAKIVVFDSGFGSLSIIKEIQKKAKSEIIYFADQKNFPYGEKSTSTLKKLILKNIQTIKEKFEPDLIVVGSNTPSLLLGDIVQNNSTIIGVLPPIETANKITKSSSVAILATKSVVKSSALIHYIKKNSKIKNIIKINASSLIDLVESGKFIYDPKFCKRKIKSTLSKPFLKNNIDVATLSSTHLPFLLPMLNEVFPNVVFLDPAQDVANQVSRVITNNSKRNTMKIFTTGNAVNFQKKLAKIGIKNKVQPFLI